MKRKRTALETNIMKDSLYHLVAESGSSVEYGKATLVGLIGGLMANGQTFEQATRDVVALMPTNARLECVPDAWLAYFRR